MMAWVMVTVGFSGSALFPQVDPLPGTPMAGAESSSPGEDTAAIHDNIWWGKVNRGISTESFDKLLEMVQLQADMMELTAPASSAARGTIVEARLDRAQALVSIARLDVERTRVRAPFSGRIASVVFSPCGSAPATGGRCCG